MSVKDGAGGPAFPCIEHAAAHGMSLRDYFAAKALAAIIEQNGRIGSYAPAPAAKEAYEYADAMLKAREAK